MFGKPTTLFNARYKCLQNVKHKADDFVTYASKVNKLCENFELSKLNSNQFKCLMFIIGLQSPDDAEIRMRLLSKIDSDTNDNLSLESLTDECQRIINLKQNALMVEGDNKNALVHFVSRQNKSCNQNNQQCNKSSNDHNQPSSPCWNCGGMHFSDKCGYKNHVCKTCSSIGHKEGYCSTAAKSKSNQNSRNDTNANSKRKKHRKIKGRTVKNSFSSNNASCNRATNKSNYAERRKYVTLSINGTKTEIQLDTTSDITIISSETWNLLGKPKLEPTSQLPRNASGDVIKLLGVLECLVECNNQNRLVKCYVSPININLLGIEWIEQFELWDIPFNSICNMITGGLAEVTNIKEQFQNLFDDNLGLCCKMKIQLSVRPGVTRFIDQNDRLHLQQNHMLKMN